VKESYVKHVILHHFYDGNFNAQFGDKWIPSDELSTIRSQIAQKAFAVYGIKLDTQYQDIVDEIFALLHKDKGIHHRGDDYTGSWYHLNNSKKNEIVKQLLSENPASKTINILPEAAFENALRQIAKEDNLNPLHDNDSEDTDENADLADSMVTPDLTDL